jgi:tetratricopeptide (TPR) repeat protein
LSAADHAQEALDEFNAVSPVNTEDWGVLLLKANIHDNLKQFQEAIDSLARFKDLAPKLLDADVEYTEVYWNDVIMLEGNCHRSAKNFEAAAACYHSLVRRKKDDAKAMELSQDAAATLIEMWETIKDYQAIINLVLAWKEGDIGSRDFGLWFEGLAPRIEFNSCLIAAAKQTDHFHTLNQLYEEILQRLRLAAVKNTSDIGAIRYSQGLLLYHAHPDSGGREMALDSWEKLLQEDQDERKPTWILYQTNQTLAQSILDIVYVEKPAVPQTAQYIDRLQALIDQESSIRQDQKLSNTDPRLMLARLYKLIGNDERARAVAREKLRDIFDDWEGVTDDTFADSVRCMRLAVALMVIDDDVNALAAWQLWQPRPIQATGGTSAKTDTPNEPIENSADQDTAKHAASDDDHACDPPESKKSENCDAVADNDLVGEYSLWCTNCDKAFPYAGGQHFCKHCMDCKFCTECYEKLQDGALRPLMCNKDHVFLHVPPFDRQVWEKTPLDMMYVGSEKVLRKAWLDGLRAQWNLVQETINDENEKYKTEVLASRTLAKAIVKWRRLGRKKEAEGRANEATVKHVS